MSAAAADEHTDVMQTDTGQPAGNDEETRTHASHPGAAAAAAGAHEPMDSEEKESREPVAPAEGSNEAERKAPEAQVPREPIAAIPYECAALHHISRQTLRSWLASDLARSQPLFNPFVVEECITETRANHGQTVLHVKCSPGQRGVLADSLKLDAQTKGAIAKPCTAKQCLQGRSVTGEIVFVETRGPKPNEAKDLSLLLLRNYPFGQQRAGPRAQRIDAIGTWKSSNTIGLTFLSQTDAKSFTHALQEAITHAKGALTLEGEKHNAMIVKAFYKGDPSMSWCDTCHAAGHVSQNCTKQAEAITLALHVNADSAMWPVCLALNMSPAHWRSGVLHRRNIPVIPVATLVDLNEEQRASVFAAIETALDGTHNDEHAVTLRESIESAYFGARDPSVCELCYRTDGHHHLCPTLPRPKANQGHRGGRGGRRGRGGRSPAQTRLSPETVQRQAAERDALWQQMRQNALKRTTAEAANTQDTEAVAPHTEATPTHTPPSKRRSLERK